MKTLEELKAKLLSELMATLLQNMKDTFWSAAVQAVLLPALPRSLQSSKRNLLPRD